MSLLQKIKAVLGYDIEPTPEEIEEYTGYPTGPPSLPSVTNTSLPIATPTPVVAPEFAKEAVPELPHWLENEEALRDEGVIFGLSDSKAEEKISIIRNYFLHRTANIEKEIEQISEKIGEINLLIGQKETRINELKEKTNWLETRKINTEHYFPRTLMGLLISIAMSIGNYFLINTTLQHNFPQNAWIISLGVFLAGMFSLFNPKSLFHERTGFDWRQLLEEVGMPLAASLFVFVQALDNQPIIRSIALFIFVFFLFLFSGKLLLGNLTVFKSDFNVFWDNQILRRDKVVKNKDWDEEIQQCTYEIDEQRVKKWQILPDLNKAEGDLARLNAQRDMMIKLFESEFHLARSYKEKLTDKQIRQIVK